MLIYIRDLWPVYNYGIQTQQRGGHSARARSVGGSKSRRSHCAGKRREVPDDREAQEGLHKLWADLVINEQKGRRPTLANKVSVTNHRSDHVALFGEID